MLQMYELHINSVLAWSLEETADRSLGHSAPEMGEQKQQGVLKICLVILMDLTLFCLLF